MPAWVRRLHADGLASQGVARPPLMTGSQRYVERWDAVDTGYSLTLFDGNRALARA